MTDFSLRALVRNVLDETDLTSPDEIAEKVAASIPKDQLRAVLAMTLRDFVRVEVTRVRSAGQNVPLTYHPAFEVPQTAPAVSELTAGNGATRQDKGPVADDAPASDPVPVVCGDRADVAPKSPADAAAMSGRLDGGASASAAGSTADVALGGDDPQTFCRCGHPWVQHIDGQLPDSELCCVDGCDMTRCPGSAVSRTLDVAEATADKARAAGLARETAS
jgi:hypothetical protein